LGLGVHEWKEIVQDQERWRDVVMAASEEEGVSP